MKKLLFAVAIIIPSLIMGQIPSNYKTDILSTDSIRALKKGKIALAAPLVYQDGQQQTKAVTNILYNNWNSAFGWGNHALAGYLTTETDPIWNSQKTDYILKNDTNSFVASPSWVKQQGYLKSFTEIDPYYIIDSSYLKGNVRTLKAVTDTASEWVARTIYVSLPNDPQTPGSDVTGTGLSTFPFATINKALRSIKPITGAAIITLQLDSGSYAYGIPERNLITKLIANSTDLGITIQGQMTKLTSYGAFTLASDANDFSKFTVTGTTFTSNELQNLYLGNSAGTSIYPIESNTTNIIYSIAATSANNIWRCNTTLVPTKLGSFGFTFNFPFTSAQISVGFVNLKITPSIAAAWIGNNTQFANCILSLGTGGYLKVASRGRISFQNSLFSNNPTSDAQHALECAEGGVIGVFGLIIKSLNATKFTTGLNPYILSGSNNIWISGYKNAFSNQFCSISNFNLTSTMNIKVSNATNILQTLTPLNSDININIPNLIIDNVDYLINNTSGASIKLIVGNKTGNLNSGIFNPSSTFKNLVSFSDGVIVKFPGVYPEIQQKIYSTLANNSTDSISVGDKSYNRTIEIKANITRGTDYQYKRIVILNTGTALTAVQQPDSVQTADLGVRIDGAYYSGSSNTIKLKWHTTNTGASSTFTYDAIRQNY